MMDFAIELEMRELAEESYEHLVDGINELRWGANEIRRLLDSEDVSATITADDFDHVENILKETLEKISDVGKELAAEERRWRV